LDLFRDMPTRPHTDLDVGVLRRDLSALLHGLTSWEVFEAKDGHLTGLPLGCMPRGDVHSLWCRPTATDPWTIELMLDEADGDAWVYRRDPRIQRPLTSIIRQSPDGLSYLVPEIQLLYKSKAPRERDHTDFAEICPCLAVEARAWLRDALELTNPDHHWLAQLRSA
jgi:hypothetical protein